VTITRERGAPTAARARGALGSFFTWCMKMGLLESNPTIGSVKPEENPGRSRVLDDREIAAIWHACGDDDFGKIVKLLICLGCRRQEIGGLTWSEVDLDRGVLTISAERSKNGRPHVLSLMPMALSILRGVPRLVSREHLFGTRGASGYTSWAQHKRALDARADVRNWVTHDTRRSVATGLANLGVPPHVIEQILGHAGHRSGISGVYNKSVYVNEVRAALGMWEDHVRTLIEGGERKILPYTPAAS
jgi:integrase